MAVEQFSIETDDGVTRLRGELGCPDGAAGPFGALLIVPGGWFMERDGFMGDSYTEADLMYRRIGNRVLRQGFAVARYDNRGVSGNELTAGLSREGQNCAAETEHYLQSCIDFDVRRTVTHETCVSDVLQIYNFVLRHSRVDPSKLVLLAHSEGGIHVARLIGRKLIDPKGVVFAAVITESPAGILEWQVVDRFVDAVMSWDRDGDGLVRRPDVIAGYESGRLFSEAGVSVEELMPPDEGWPRLAWETFFRQRYDLMKADGVGTDGTRPYPVSSENREFVAASYHWWKQWFTDEMPTIELLRDYTGRASFHFGEIDSQTPASREMAFANSRRHMLSREPELVLHANRGHAFRSGEPCKGPMDAHAEDLFVEDLTAMLRAL